VQQGLFAIEISYSHELLRVGQTALSASPQRSRSLVLQPYVRGHLSKRAVHGRILRISPEKKEYTVIRLDRIAFLNVLKSFMNRRIYLSKMMKTPACSIPPWAIFKNIKNFCENCKHLNRTAPAFSRDCM
jgi:hypothetical protein